MKRLIAFVAGLALLPLAGFAPRAEALGGGTCTISGTIAFEPATGPYMQGVWNIRPGAIDCKGAYKGPDYFTGQGPFIGTGTYKVLPSGTGTCIHQVGEGSVDYTLVTNGGWYRLTEKSEFVLAGAGKFTTPSMNGSFVIPPPYEGDCITSPVTRATFVAQVLLVR
ncbi:MAG TPA: hypothetical protein VJS45_16950 [Acidimicrobiia bacterium]|nr:hypothetical protein [Acidimicrobiia bacterium]